MVIKLILAGIAILAVALRPRSRAAAAIALGAGAFSGDIVAAALAAAPMLLFLTVALALAWLAMRSGLTEWAATVLARWGKGRTLRLYALVCSISALLTIVLSLDGAVVLMVPLVSALVRRCGVRFSPFLFGVVAVANASSLAVPEGNPTNLVVMSRLGLGPEMFLQHLFVPGACAALLCALVPVPRVGPRSYANRADDGYQSTNGRFLVPWRIGAQIVGLLAALRGLVPSVALSGHTFGALLIVAAGIAGASAIANNLPVGAAVATFITAGPGVYAALIGLTVGALATPHGSVATMIGRELAGEDGELSTKALASAAALAVLGATFFLWTILAVSSS